jgi:hypothetical protein
VCRKLEIDSHPLSMIIIILLLCGDRGDDGGGDIAYASYVACT